MCRHHDLDASGGVDITQGREVLPKNVKPTNYSLELEPDLEKFTFEGTVAITYVERHLALPFDKGWSIEANEWCFTNRLDVVEDSTTIAVNDIELEIKDVKLEYDGKTKTPAGTSRDDEVQTTTWTFKDTIPAGTEATLTIKYKGNLNDNMAGTYS